MAELTLENRLLKKSVTADGERRRMRYPASEKLEIIRLVEQSHLPVRAHAGEARHPAGDLLSLVRSLPDAAGRRPSTTVRPRPDRVWNRIPDDVREPIIDLALDEPELSPRELAVRFTDSGSYFVSEASVYRLLKAHDLITSPAFIVIKAADEFPTRPRRPTSSGRPTSPT